MLAIEKRLEVNGETVELVGEKVTLELGAVGRGRFTVRGLEGPPGNVPARFLAGLQGEGRVMPVLVGAVAESALVGADEWLLTVLEPSALLKLPAAFALRHCTPREVLAAIEGVTGLSFLLPGDGAYLARRLPRYAPAGTCRAALEAMGGAWGVADAVWSGLPDGRVYWGPWASGPWGTEVIGIDPALIVSREERALTIAYIPYARPGVTIRDSAAGGDPVMVRRVVFGGRGARVEWGEL